MVRCNNLKPKACLKGSLDSSRNEAKLDEINCSTSCITSVHGPYVSFVRACVRTFVLFSKELEFSLLLLSYLVPYA